MSLKLNGATSGSIELDVPAAIGSDLNVTLPATAGEIVVANTSGDVDLGGLTVSGSAADDSVNIDSSGRLLVGTSTARSNLDISTSSATPQFQLEGTSFSNSAISIIRNSTATGASSARLFLGKSNGASVGSNVIVADDDLLGQVVFNGNDDTNFIEAASIGAEVDGTPGANNMPGRLVFSTTADGASSPTERMRIDNAGGIMLGKNTTSLTSTGASLNDATSTAAYFAVVNNATSTSARVVIINRQASDGRLIEFRQANILEGYISVTTTTVSLVGAHLSRWSQLPKDSSIQTILKGTVLSNLDEMCEWEGEDNEQLNRMKISDVEGDPNVAGVLDVWDEDEDYPDDFSVAMTGDFIIRIAQGTTVQRGDLLMSAGDGTAKPQDDDIIRSKTIAKVTSTNVSCTYDDGSYCVPCVLMAC